MTSTEITRASVGLRSERGPILLAVMLSIGLVAIDATILATAVPSIVGDLGGFTQFPWLFSVVPAGAGGLGADLRQARRPVGRKPVMLVGIGLFLAGSLLCGLAWGMTWLIVFRAVQGLGAGAVQPMGMTIVGDIYRLAERAKVQGYLASVWAVSSVVGPTLGGVFADFLSWRWIFFVNLPLGALAAGDAGRRFHEQVERRTPPDRLPRRRPARDRRHAAPPGLLEGGERWAWDSRHQRAARSRSASPLLVAFVLVERRAAEPVLPLWVLRRPGPGRGQPRCARASAC